MIRKKAKEGKLAQTIEFQPVLRAQRKRKIRCSIDEVERLSGVLEEEMKDVKEITSGIKKLRLDDGSGDEI